MQLAPHHCILRLTQHCHPRDERILDSVELLMSFSNLAHKICIHLVRERHLSGVGCYATNAASVGRNNLIEVSSERPLGVTRVTRLCEHQGV